MDEKDYMMRVADNTNQVIVQRSEKNAFSVHSDDQK